MSRKKGSNKDRIIKKFNLLLQGVIVKYSTSSTTELDKDIEHTREMLARMRWMINY